jgi:hypothetical protein
MPEFYLNDDKPSPSYEALNDFAKGYIEAMFFTNEGVDAETYGEDYLNELGVRRLVKSAVADIAKDCAAFWTANETELRAAMDLEPGTETFKYAKEHLDERRLGHLFFYARQGHGVSFLDDGNDAALECLQVAARAFGAAYPETYRGWIYHR